MHELSIALSIVELAERHARGRGAGVIEEIELEIGALAAVEMSALDFALESVVKGTLAEKAKITRHIIAGEGVCENCGARVPMKTLCMPCPQCAMWQLRVTRGKELRVKSIVVDT
jgi:hydrogenase nickel incorporation protein HypA/HybF